MPVKGHHLYMMFSVLSITLHDSRAGLRGKPTWQLPGAPAHKEHWNNLKYSANKSGFHAQKKNFLGKLSTSLENAPRNVRQLSPRPKNLKNISLKECQIISLPKVPICSRLALVTGMPDIRCQSFNKVSCSHEQNGTRSFLHVISFTDLLLVLLLLYCVKTYYLSAYSVHVKFITQKVEVTLPRLLRLTKLHSIHNVLGSSC